jgi:hypothetical protein
MKVIPITDIFNIDNITKTIQMSTAKKHIKNESTNYFIIKNHGKYAIYDASTSRHRIIPFDEFLVAVSWIRYGMGFCIALEGLLEAVQDIIYAEEIRVDIEPYWEKEVDHCLCKLASIKYDIIVDNTDIIENVITEIKDAYHTIVDICSRSQYAAAIRENRIHS